MSKNMLKESIRNTVRESINSPHEQLNENKNVKKYMKKIQNSNYGNVSEQVFINPEDSDNVVLLINTSSKDIMIEFKKDKIVKEKELRSGELRRTSKTYQDQGWIKSSFQSWASKNKRGLIRALATGSIGAVAGAAMTVAMVGTSAGEEVSSDIVDWFSQKYNDIFGSDSVIEPTPATPQIDGSMQEKIRTYEMIFGDLPSGMSDREKWETVKQNLNKDSNMVDSLLKDFDAIHGKTAAEMTDDEKLRSLFKTPDEVPNVSVNSDNMNDTEKIQSLFRSPNEVKMGADTSDSQAEKLRSLFRSK